jgi:hypothetical protein
MKSAQRFFAFDPRPAGGIQLLDALAAPSRAAASLRHGAAAIWWAVRVGKDHGQRRCGRCLGIGANVLMEFVKPYIFRKYRITNIKKRLAEEMRDNLSALEECYRVFEEAGVGSEEDQRRAMAVASIVAQRLRSDRWEFYLDEQKELIFELDESTILGVYSSFTKRLPEALIVGEFFGVMAILRLSMDAARAFFDPKLGQQYS